MDIWPKDGEVTRMSAYPVIMFNTGTGKSLCEFDPEKMLKLSRIWLQLNSSCVDFAYKVG